MDLLEHESEEWKLKRALADRVNEPISGRGISQNEAAAKIGTTQSKASQINRYNLKNISVGRPLQALVALEQHIDIVIRQSGYRTCARVTVAG